MSEITINKIEKEYGVKKILDKVSFTINKNDRIGLIGKNGTGKTTIFRLIIGSENCDYGEIIKRKGLRIGCLDQIHDYPDNSKVIDILELPFKEVKQMKIELDKLNKILETTTENESSKIYQETMKSYGFLQQKFENLGGYEIQNKIKNVCLGLKINETLKNCYFTDLSGGEQITVVLAKILLEDVDVLFLDEPTNHLDIESVEWLEEFLRHFKGAVVAISHDRFFLDRVVNKIIEIENKNIVLTNGNYSTHVSEKYKRFLNIERQFRKQKNEIKLLETSIKKTRITAKKQANPGLLRKATNLEAKLARMIRISKPKKTKNIIINLKKADKSSKFILRLSKIYKSFGESSNRKEILKDLDFSVRSNEKVAILGKNGIGKSTLIKIIMQQIESDSGEIKLGAGNKIAYLDQDLRFENDDLIILDYVLSYLGVDEFTGRRLLAKFLFTKDEISKKIKDLSSGERTRLKLAILFSKDINTLILDEPTNHLDIDSREILEEAIANFGKTLIFISHDRYFIAKMAERVVEIKDKKIIDYEGNYTVYLDKKYGTTTF